MKNLLQTLEIGILLKNVNIENIDIFPKNVDIFPRNVNIYQRKGKKGLKSRENNDILPLKYWYFYEKSQLLMFEMSITITSKRKAIFMTELLTAIHDC